MQLQNLIGTFSDLSRLSNKFFLILTDKCDDRIQFIATGLGQSVLMIYQCKQT